MSTVGPSDGGYQYYQRNISDLEDDLKNESARARKHEKERTEALEDHYMQVVRDHDDENADTIRKYKENADQTIANERAYSKGEVDRIKAETYDKYGRYNGQEADVLRSELDAVKKQANAQYDRDQRSQREAESAYNARLDQVNDDYNDKLTSAVQQARDAATAAYENSAASSKADSQEYRDENRRNSDEAQRSHMSEMNELRRRYERATAEMKRDYDHQVDRLSKTDDTRYNDAMRFKDHQQMTQTRALNASHAEEASMLRAQQRDLEDTMGNYAHGRAQGQQDAVRDYEDDWRTRMDLEQEAYENQIDDLRQKSAQQESNLNNKFGQVLSEKEKHYAHVIQNQNQENHAEKSRMLATFSADRDAMDLRAEKDREQAQRVLEARIGDMNEQSAVTLDNQARAFQDTLSRESADHREQTRALEKELQYRRTSADSEAISPAAEDKLRKSVTGQYEKIMDTETKKNRATVDSIQQNYADRLHDTVIEHQSNERRITMANAQQTHEMQNDFMDHVNNVEETKQQALRNKDLDNDRMTQNLTRNYANMLNKQKAEHDDALQIQQNEAATRLNASRQENTFSQRMAQRAFANQQNELIRDYDRKLAAQKTDYEAKIDEMKTTQQKTLRDQDRLNKQQLTEMQRSYDQRIAQTEAQHAERERYLTQNYQDELEKVRRANALLIQKKS